MKPIKIIALLFLVILLGLTIFYSFKKRNTSSTTIGADSNDVISSQADWNQGSMYNIAVSELGSIDIDEVGETKLDLSDTDNITCNSQTENEQYLGDGEIDTGYWGGSVDNRPQDGWYCEFDLGETKRIVSARINFESTDEFSPYTFVIHKSLNGSDWGAIPESTLYFPPPSSPAVWYDYPMSNPYEDARYIRMIPIESPPPTISGYFREFELYVAGATATHTTAPTQIDGQEGSDDKTLIQWTSFTPTQTVPENTTISYQFRTSSDASEWTDWTGSYAYSGDPISLTGLDDDRYLQVKATLASTDGISTPQVGSYTINFHNNQKPNQPTAQTVTVE